MAISQELDALKAHAAQRARYVAKRQGANLLYHIAHAIEKGRDPGAAGSDEQKFIAYVGHDTNIANVAALLDVHWHLPEYPEDDMPPGAALIFEVREPPPPDQKQWVCAFFAAQSPDGMRLPQSSNIVRPPPTMAAVPIKNCGGPHGPCPLSDFRTLVKQALDFAGGKDCITDRRQPPPTR